MMRVAHFHGAVGTSAVLYTLTNHGFTTLLLRKRETTHMTHIPTVKTLSTFMVSEYSIAHRFLINTMGVTMIGFGNF